METLMLVLKELRSTNILDSQQQHVQPFQVYPSTQIHERNLLRLDFFSSQVSSDLHQVLFGECRLWLVWKMQLRNSHNHSIIAQGNISIPTLMYPKYMQMFACSFSETTGELGVGWGPGNFSGLEYFWKKDSKFNFESTVVQEKRLPALRDHARSFIPRPSLKLPVLMMEGVDEQPDSRLVP